MTRSVELRMRARPENLVLARLALSGVARGAGLTEEITSDLRLAITEACTNVIQHAYAGSDPGDSDVVVRFVLEQDALVVEVNDSGVGFDPESLESSPPEEPAEAGMGLRIIKALADEVEITTGASGSRLVLVRRFSSGG